MLPQGIDTTKDIFNIGSPYSMAKAARIRGFSFFLTFRGISVCFY